MMKQTIALIGGDKRQLYVANSLLKSEFDVIIVGFDKINCCSQLKKTDIYTGLQNAEIIIFPVTGTQGRIVPNEYSEKEIVLTDDFLEVLKSKTIFCGKSHTLQALSSELRIKDYLQREEFAVANALPTAEGAVQIAMEQYSGMIFGSSCLVIGYGRIGKILSRMLKALNAKVSVSARKADHLRYITSDGNKAVKTQDIQSLEDYDIVFNTVPKLIINKHILAKTEQNTLIIDLASAPGGVDFETAEKLGIKAIQALSLPGKCSPKAAGEIISDTILDMIKEEYRWQKLV